MEAWFLSVHFLLVLFGSMADNMEELVSKKIHKELLDFYTMDIAQTRFTRNDAEPNKRI